MFEKRRRIRSYKTRALRNILAREMIKGTIDPELSWNDLSAAVHDWAQKQRIILPPDNRLGTIIRSARARAVGRRHRAQQEQREEAMGFVLRDLPLVQRFTAARELIRYPPAWQGKANLITMARETQIRSELEHVFAINHIQPEPLLGNSPEPDSFRLIESTPPSLLSRTEKRAVIAALPIYLAKRWQQARDVVITCFVRKARSLRFRIKEQHDQAVREHSLSLLEHSGPRLRALRRAVLHAIDKNDPSVLKVHRRFLAHMENRQEEIIGSEGLFSILAGRGGYARKFALRLKGIPFEGHDNHARTVVECLPEIFTFHPFRVQVPWPVVNRLHFLDVPPETIRRRRVFEPVILMTLADLIGSGRVTVPNSLLFRDLWTDISSVKLRKTIDTDRWIDALQSKLNRDWIRFVKVARKRDIAIDGQIHVPRIRATETDEGPGIRLPTIPIERLLWEVHDEIGFLDCFRLPENAPHSLSDEERRQLSLANLMATGMNMGLREGSRSFGRGYGLGRLRNAAAHYVYPKTLQATLDRLLQEWDRRNFGSIWGTGERCSVDGRVVFSYEKNLISQYHHRRGRIGVMAYWFVRDDWMASTIRLIGNQEHEAWFILDELLRPSGMKVLKSSCGDTHCQQLALWGLSSLVGKRILARFRGLRGVRLYCSRSGKHLPIRQVHPVRWDLLRRCARSLQRLGEAVRQGIIPASEVLKTWNIYDEEGRNVGDALRELGKIDRTGYILSYAMDKKLRATVQRGCTRSETWNSFMEAIAWAGGGRIATNDPRRRIEIGLSMAILMNAIVFHNVWKYGDRLKRVKGATPIQWGHVRFYGKYKIRRGPTQEGSLTENGDKSG